MAYFERAEFWHRTRLAFRSVRPSLRLCADQITRRPGRSGFVTLWGQAKPETLLESSDAESNVLYESIEPLLLLGLPFVQTEVSEHWFDWPALPDLFPMSFPGVQTKRDAFLIDTDLDRLKARIGDYFDTTLSHEEIARRYPVAMKNSSGFVVPDARKVAQQVARSRWAD